ncbi:CooT family nickel-binding protein [Clostridium luticellarii]|jgi:predicted RNA-binding protein|uniref:Putative RNA-binding protein n=1 Tax=Clostridium luticellarii TaxID=1691940 RepID=A0A2T0BSZ1_9CLOT|nr:CooT family nickel-binding protein [Clostridium luticellarii]MCI1946181.1 CooT family nickel-binding protein [Clostridium luticellarii]MCI1969482.1 CooT family nickel-binding protein [Clostridium luticellarii]MCI1995459.1 CooT family nickel-binding protein [Clostridium luticellarii]MCI2040629.1 CooT family nickel-binding protein [Clostridium luticellarii]PRR86962.1 putative RNA-binding protein [Clostridium luticellarii]
MCESTAYLVTPEGERKIMDYVVDIVPKENGRLSLTDILGEEEIIEGMLKEVRLLEHKIVIEKAV